MVKFVKNPTTNWADLDQQEADRESSYSKQMLKEMIERKRRNDFVRKREFDMLRKMRRSEVMAGQDPAARPSFFQSSMPSKPDDRATTLKKIDEIEAQMSMQWWKTKHGETSSRSPISGSAPMSSHVPLEHRPAVGPAAYSRTEPQPLERDLEKTAPVGLEPTPDSVAPLEFSFTPEPSAPLKPAAALPPDRRRLPPLFPLFPPLPPSWPGTGAGRAASAH